MREILFRGKRVDNGEWFYGVPTIDSRGQTVIVENVFDCDEYNCRGASCLYVDENTIGQYTGLTDKNGKKIFEGDIVHAVYSDGYIGVPNTDYGNLIVGFDDTYYGGACYSMKIIGDTGYRIFSAGLRNGVTVIGNVHDNP